MASVRPFHRYRGESSFSMPEFLMILRELIPHVAPLQKKYRVTELPTDRTIRYYTANGLVDKPAAKEGTRALYGYRQLLQVLAIKYLQSQYLPLVKVRSLVENISNRDLEQLIPDLPSVTATHRGIARDDKQVVGNSFIPQAFVFHSPQAPHEQTPAVSINDVRVSDSWRRVEIGPGIELHIHALALSESAIEQLRGALLRELGVLRGWFEEEKK